MADIGDYRILQSNKKPALFLNVAGMALTMLGIFCIFRFGFVMGGGITAMGAMMLFLSIVLLLKSDVFIELHPDHFLLNTGADSRKIMWQQCSSFQTFKEGRNEGVLFTLIEEDGAPIYNLSPVLKEGKGVLQADYAMKPQQLADLLNAYQHKSVMQR